MSMRISSIVVFGTVLLAGCSGRADNEVLAEAEERQSDAAAEDGRIECAIGEGSNFTKTCETERLSGPDGTMLIVRHPDGGFRRFEVLTDGRGLAAADGSEQAKIEIVADGKISVTVGEDRYMLPARVGSVAKAGDAAPAEAPTEAPTETDAALAE